MKTSTAVLFYSVSNGQSDSVYSATSLTHTQTHTQREREREEAKQWKGRMNYGERNKK